MNILKRHKLKKKLQNDLNNVDIYIAYTSKYFNDKCTFEAFTCTVLRICNLNFINGLFLCMFYI